MVNDGGLTRWPVVSHFYQEQTRYDEALVSVIAETLCVSFKMEIIPRTIQTHTDTCALANRQLRLG